MAFWSGWFSRRDSDPELATPPVTLANVRLQIFSERYFGMRMLDRTAACVRPLAPGLIEAIVEDIGGGERTLRWEYLRNFALTDAELFALARAQAARCERDVATEVLDGIDVLVSNGFYLGAHVLESLAARRLAFGALVAPVTWHHWCVHVIDARTVAAQIQMMRFLAQSIASQANVADAERLTTDVYWLRPTGQLERIAMQHDAPLLPPELARALRV